MVRSMVRDRTRCPASSSIFSLCCALLTEELFIRGEILLFRTVHCPSEPCHPKFGVFYLSSWFFSQVSYFFYRRSLCRAFLYTNFANVLDRASLRRASSRRKVWFRSFDTLSLRLPRSFPTKHNKMRLNGSHHFDLFF